MIYIVHPITEDLAFFKKFIKKLKEEFPENVIHLELSNNFISHSKALNSIAKIEPNDLLILLLHGRDDKFLGSTYKNGHPSVHRQRYVHDEEGRYFINAQNIDLLKNKKVIAVACNSYGLGNKLKVETFTRFFLSFNEINFDTRENKYPKKAVESNVKFEFREALFHSLITAVKKDYTIKAFSQHLKILLDKAFDRLILNTRGSKNKNRRAAYCIKEIQVGIKILGDDSIRIND